VLGVYDRDSDGVKGRVDSFALTFTVRECTQTFHWREVPKGPPPRAQHTAVGVRGAVFVFGGRTHHLLHDLWRYSPDKGWRELRPLASSGQLGAREASGRIGLLTPLGLLLFGGLRDAGLAPPRAGLYDGRLEHRVWRQDLWSEEWAPLPVADPRDSYVSGTLPRGRGPTQPHMHRAVGGLSGEGAPFPPLFEDAPSGGRYLAAAAYLAEGSGAGGAGGGGVFAFGGDDGARTFSDDLRRLSLGAPEDPAGVCAYSLRPNSTAAEAWAECIGDTGGVGACSLVQVLQRASCEGKYQPIGFL
jgi:hypothetical protein